MHESETDAEPDLKHRFAFGANWQRFLTRLSPQQIEQAEESLRILLATSDLREKSFLDIGSGSGLFSLAARRLGARVHSFDFDPQSVACAHALRDRFLPQDSHWTIERASVLDADYLQRLGKFDIVYSWGVLHHTGQMWRAFENAMLPLDKGGQLAIAVYNHQPLWTPFWTAIKRTYVASPRPLKIGIAAASIAYHAVGGLARDVIRFRNPVTRYRNYNRLRGMSWWHDQLDWVGGYPFETAKPQSVIDFYTQRDLTLQRWIPCRPRSSGCNQFVFRREASDA